MTSAMARWRLWREGVRKSLRDCLGSKGSRWGRGLREGQGGWRAVGKGLRDCSLSDVIGRAFDGEGLYYKVEGLLFGGW